MQHLHLDAMIVGSPGMAPFKECMWHTLLGGLQIWRRGKTSAFFCAVVEGDGFESCVGLFLFLPSVSLVTVGVGGHEHY